MLVSKPDAGPPDGGRCRNGYLATGCPSVTGHSVIFVANALHMQVIMKCVLCCCIHSPC